MSELSIISKSKEETQALGEELASFAKADDVFILSGDLGAGKTQFSKGFALGLGITDVVSSPTFNLVLVYEDGWIKLNHFDLYRLENESELEGIDFFGLIESEGVSLIEWGDRFDLVRDLSDVLIMVEFVDESQRSLTFTALSERGQEIIRAFMDDRINA